eukprot:6251922-Ditylum_brightwellii.AAC.1
MMLMIMLTMMLKDGDDDGNDDSFDSADKHLTHLSQGVDYHLTQRSKQKMYDVGNKDDDDNCDVEDSVASDVEDGGDDSVDDGVDDGVGNDIDDGGDSADKHLTHFSQGVDCHLTWRSKGNKYVVGDKDNDVDDGTDNGVDHDVKDGDDDSVKHCNDGANKHLIHLSKGFDCHLTQRRKQNQHVVGVADNDVDIDVDDD